ncbi:MAG: AAA family ATPase [Gammaproteobacteria bacterium]|jgi:predicted ATPase|nr:AAA family ATPase [Gammaproteobacteria bacterium]
MKPTTAPDQLTRLKLEGYKSIAQTDLPLGALNVLVGANGAGKSNLIGFFKLMRDLIDARLQLHVGQAGGPDALLHFGRKTTEQLVAELTFGERAYWVRLAPTADNRLIFALEGYWWQGAESHRLGSGHFETLCRAGEAAAGQEVVAAMARWVPYHFHDTGEDARVKQIHGLNDNAYLRPDARNLAAYLLRLRETDSTHYQRILRTVQLVAPFFGDFHLRPTPANPDRIELEWVERGQDVPFKAHALSDGTLRFICLATLLLQPPAQRPATILIDEPELGLHPFAMTVLAAMLKAAASTSQLIVSTQSVELVNELDAEDLLVVDRQQGCSSFSRLDEQALREWLGEYSLGELWKKNLIGGRPTR